jgi:RND family efflux transporter MFP subunit
MKSCNGFLSKRVYMSCFLSISLFVQGCSNEIEIKAEVIRPVKSIVVVESSGDQRRTLPGKVQAANKVDLSFQVSGPLVDLPVSKGQNVKKGELLAKIDPRDFQSKLKAAEAQFKKSKADLARIKPLVKKNLVSKSDVDKYEALFDVSEADYERAKKALGDTNIKAPFAGVVADIFVENFQDVQAKESVLSLQDNNNLEIVVQVPEREIVGRDSDKNLELKVFFETLPGKEFPATVKEYATEADANTQTYEVILAIDVPSDINLLPGMSASVVALKKTKDGQEKKIYVPVTAVFKDPSGKKKQYVWLVSQDKTVNRQEVVVGALSNSQIEITTGLSIGQRVVIAGVHYLVEGQKVKGESKTQ